MIQSRMSFAAAIATLFAVIVLGMPALAQARWGATQGNSTASIHLHTLRLGFMQTHFNYAEHPSKPYYDTTTGSFPGFAVGFENFSNRFYMDWQFSYGSGTDHYNGSLMNLQTGATTPYQSRETDYLLEERIDLGPAFYTGTRRNIIAPYAGLFARLQEGDTPPPYGYSTRRTSLAGDFGLTDRVAITPRLQAELRAGGTYNLGGFVRNTLGNSGRYHDHKIGYQASITLDYHLWKAIGLFAQAEFDQVPLGRVDFNSLFYEPTDRTYEQHYSVGGDFGRF